MTLAGCWSIRKSPAPPLDSMMRDSPAFLSKHPAAQDSSQEQRNKGWNRAGNGSRFSQQSLTESLPMPNETQIF